MLQLKMNENVISGWVEFHQDDIAIITAILGDFLKQIGPSDYVTHRIARWENAPEEILDKLTPHWGLFEWIIDEKE